MPIDEWDDLASKYGVSLPKPKNPKAAALRKAATSLGVNPADLGSIISFESGGTFDPHKLGGEGNKYRGLIQFGPDEQKKYYKSNDTFESQLENGVVPYFRDRFKQAGKSTEGATLEDLYTTVIAGNPGANRNKTDSFGTSARSGTRRILKEHRPGVLKTFFDDEEPTSGVDFDALTNAYGLGGATEQSQAPDDFDLLSQKYGLVDSKGGSALPPTQISGQTIQQPDITKPPSSPLELGVPEYVSPDKKGGAVPSPTFPNQPPQVAEVPEAEPEAPPIPPRKQTQEDVQQEFDIWSVGRPQTQDTADEFNRIKQAEIDLHNEVVHGLNERQKFNADIDEMGRIAASAAKGELSPDAAFGDFITENNLPRDNNSVKLFNADVEMRNAEAVKQNAEAEAQATATAKFKAQPGYKRLESWAVNRKADPTDPATVQAYNADAERRVRREHARQVAVYNQRRQKQAVHPYDQGTQSIANLRRADDQKPASIADLRRAEDQRPASIADLRKRDDFKPISIADLRDDRPKITPIGDLRKADDIGVKRIAARQEFEKEARVRAEQTIGEQQAGSRDFSALGDSMDRNTPEGIERRIEEETQRVVSDVDNLNAEVEDILSKTELEGLRDFKLDPTRLVPFVSSIVEMKGMRELLDSANRVKEGKADQMDLARLRHFAAKEGTPKSALYEIFDTMAQAPAFIGEMLASGGIYSGVKQGLKNGSFTLLKKLATEEGLKALETQAARKLFKVGGATAVRGATKAAKFGIEAATTIAASAPQTLVAAPFRIGKDVYRNQLPEVQVSENEAKKLQGIVTKEGDDASTALKRAVAGQFGEIFSEHSGGALAFIPVPQRLQAIKAGIAKWWLAAKPGRTLGGFADIIKKGGWHGPIGEMFEERVVGAYDYARSEADSPIPTLQQLLVEGVTFTAMGGAFKGIEKVQGRLNDGFKDVKMSDLTQDELVTSHKIIAPALAEGDESVKASYDKITKELERRNINPDEAKLSEPPATKEVLPTAETIEPAAAVTRPKSAAVEAQSKSDLAPAIYAERTKGMVLEAPLRPETEAVESTKAAAIVSGQEVTRESQKLEKETGRRINAERAAELDEPTGLGNKAAFNRALPKAEADPNKAIITLDLNGLKAANDQHPGGHAAGDAYIKEAADALKTAQGGNGQSFRSGGDELSGINTKDVAPEVIKKAEDIFGVKSFVGKDGKTYQVSLTGTFGDTFKEADSQLTEAKTKAKIARAKEVGIVAVDREGKSLEESVTAKPLSEMTLAEFAESQGKPVDDKYVQQQYEAVKKQALKTAKTVNDVPVLPTDKQVSVEAEPTAMDAFQSVTDEKVNPRTGLTKTQTEFLAKELRAVALEKLENTHGDKTTKEFLKRWANDGGFPSHMFGGSTFKMDKSIDIPGDGSFKVESVEAANRLHQKVTGKPIEGFEKAKNASIPMSNWYGETRPRNGVKQREAFGGANNLALELYGTPEKATAILKEQRRQFDPKDPDDAKQLIALDQVIKHFEEDRGRTVSSASTPLTTIGKEAKTEADKAASKYQKGYKDRATKGYESVVSEIQPQMDVIRRQFSEELPTVRKKQSQRYELGRDQYQRGLKQLEQLYETREKTAPQYREQYGAEIAKTGKDIQDGLNAVIGYNPQVRKLGLPEGVTAQDLLEAINRKTAQWREKYEAESDYKKKRLWQNREAELRPAKIALETFLGAEGGTTTLKMAAGDFSLDSIYNDKGNINYEKLTNVAGRIEHGELEVVRLDRQAERGRIKGGRRNVESTLILAGDAAAGQATRTGDGARVESHANTVRRQERLLEHYAKRNDIWFKQGHFPERLYIGKGGEARVYQKDETRVVKLVDPREIDKSLTPQKFLDNRISLFNHLFPESHYELMGFMRDGDGKFRFVVTQPFIKGTEIKSQADVDAAMQTAGLERTGRESYSNALYEVHDMHVGNVLKDADGNIFVIDAVPKAKNVEEFKVAPKPDAAIVPQTETKAFADWFGDSQVIDENGKPLVVYSGHANIEFYDRYSPKAGVAGGFYATENPEVSSVYALGKRSPSVDFDDNNPGMQYRFKTAPGSKAKFAKKIYDIQLTPEQQKTAKDFLMEEGGYDVEEYWRDNRPHDAHARRALVRGGLRDLQSIFHFMENMGENVWYADHTSDAPYFEKQQLSSFEKLMDRMGLQWRSLDFEQPGNLPLYLSIQNPIYASEPFPPDLLQALKKKASQVRDPQYSENVYWQKDIAMKEWVKNIEDGDLYWSTAIPAKALETIKSFGYDGIKEFGNKQAENPAERQANWIAFDPGQIKSAIGNRGTFDPNDPNILKQVADEESKTYLQEILPKAHSQDLMERANVELKEGNLEMNEEAGELLRRLMVSERVADEASFYGLTQNQRTLRKLAKAAHVWAERYQSEQGYTKDQVRGLMNLSSGLMKLSSQKFGVSYIFEDALSEETHHQLVMTATNGKGFSKETIAELKKNPLWNSLQFELLYPNKSDQVRAIELAAKLETEQDYWNEKGRATDKQKADFEENKKAFLNIIADDIIDRNTVDGVFTLDAVQYARIINYSYANTKTSDAARTQEVGTDEERDSGTVEPPGTESEATGVEDQETTRDDNGAADPTEKESREQIDRKLRDTDRLFKNRKYAETLREAGYTDSPDVPYIPDTEKQWVAEAQRIIASSKQDDYRTAERIFFDKATSRQQKTVLGIALLDHLGALGEMARLDKVATELVKHVGTAAQALRASQLAGKYDFATGMMIANRSKARTGKSLTDTELEKVKQKLLEITKTVEEKAALEFYVEELKTAVAEKDADIAELENAIKESKDEAKKDAERLKRQIAYWKSQKLRSPRTINAQFKKELIEKRASLEDILRNAFGSGIASLKMAAPSSLEDKVYNALVDLATLDILEYKTPEETIEHLNDLTNGTLTDVELRDIHLEAYNATKGTRPTLDEDAKQKIEAKRANRQFANETRGQASKVRERPNRYDREIIEYGKANDFTDAEILGAILIPKIRTGEAVTEWKRIMGENGTDGVFKRSYNLRRSANDNIKQKVLETKAEKENFTGDLKGLEQELIHKNIAARHAKGSFDAYARRLSRNWGEMTLDLSVEGVSLFKGLSAWGEVSYLLRQGFVLLLTDTRAALKGDWKGVGHGLQGDNEMWKFLADKTGFEDAAQYLSDHSVSVFIEKIRQHPRFLEAQNNGVRFSQIGDFNIADDHFSTRLLEKVPLYKRAEIAYTLPGDLQRLYIYDAWAKILEEQNLSPDEFKTAKKYIAETANAFTGKGDVAKILEKGGTVAKLLNLAFFSPQLLFSRFQSLNRLTFGWATAPKGLKVQMAKKGMRFYGIIAVLGYLLGMIMDPEDDDFGKIHVSKDSPLTKINPDAEDLHIDFLAGMDVPAQLYFRTAAGMVKSLTKGDTGYFSDAMKANWSEFGISKQGQPRFARSKLSPGASLVVDAATGTDFIGKPFTWWGGLTSRTVPLAWQQTYDAYLYDRYKEMVKEPRTFEYAKAKLSENERKELNALMVMAGTFTGLGVTQYPKESRSKAMELAQRLSPAVSKKDAETLRQEGGLRNLLKAKFELLQQEKPTLKVDREIERWMDINPALNKEFNKINGQAKSKTGLLSYYVKDLNQDQLRRVRELASDPDEIFVLDQMLKKATRRQNR